MARATGLRLTTDESREYGKALRTPAQKKDASDSERKAAIHAEALERFQLCQDAESAQRERELEDLQFARALPEDHWPDEIRRARAGGIASDGKVLPERPTLVINKLAQPITLAVAEARDASLGIIVKPKGDSANTDGADLRQGMIRCIEQDSNAAQARLWAMERALHCGRGYYRVLTEYSNDGDFDLDIRVSRILEQGCVYLDPYATAPDWRDGEFAFITEDLSREEYARRFGDEALEALSGDEFSSLTDQPPDWVTSDSIRVAEYYYVEHRDRTLVRLPTGETAFEDELPEGLEMPADVPRRQVDDRRVKWCILDAAEVRDEQDWPG